VFLPPFPLAREAVILAALKDGGLAEKDAPGSALLPPPFLAGLARSVHDLVAEIPRRGETGWALYDGAVLRFWRRDGPYLFPKMPPQEYGAFAERCLEAGLVVSPDYDTPSIVPWQANKGDFSALCRQ
jgi:hypothetical protein